MRGGRPAIEIVLPCRPRPVTAKERSLPPDLQVWVDARKRYRLSHAHVQMARELGLNPRKFGKIR